MITIRRPGRIVIKMAVAITLVMALGLGGYFLHQHRKSAAVAHALTAGTTAFDNREYSKAALELGRYLTAHRDDVPVLMKYAEVQLRRRPPSQGATQQAINAYESVLRLQPGHAEAAENLIDIYLATGGATHAERVARGWTEICPEDPLAQAYLVRALLADNEGEALAKETETLEKKLAQQPGHVEAAAILAGAYRIQAGRVIEDNEANGLASSTDSPVARALQLLDKADEVLDRLVKAAPDSAGARVTRAGFWNSVLFTRDRLEAAHRQSTSKPSSEEANADQPPAQDSNPPVLAERREPILDDLKAAAKLESSDPNVLLQLADLQFRCGLRQEAETHFDLAEKAAPDNAAVYLPRGHLLLETGHFAAGAAWADRALKAPLGERRYDILPLAMEFYANAERQSDAETCLAEFKERGGPSENLLYLQGVIELAKDEPYKAIVSLERAIAGAEAVKRPLPRAHLLLARCYIQCHNPRRAVEPLKRYIQQRRGTPVASAQLQLAGVYFQLGRWEEAAKAAQDAHSQSLWEARLLGIGDSPFFQSLFLQADLAKLGGNKPNKDIVERLRKQITTMMEHSPDLSRNTALNELLARVLVSQGRLDEAVRTMKALRDTSEDKRAVTLGLANVYAEAGDYDSAVREITAVMATAEDEDKPALQRHLARLHDAKGDLPTARKLLDEAIAHAEGPLRRDLALTQASYLLRQDKQGQDDEALLAERRNQARALLTRIASEDPSDVRPRLRLLAMGPSDGQGPSQQRLVDELKRIQGEAGLEWRYWQARLWLQSDDWRTHQDKIKSLLDECLDKDPAWAKAITAMSIFCEKTGDMNQAVDLCRRGFLAAPSNAQLGMRFLLLASRQERWDDVDVALNMLGAIEDASLQKALEEHRFAQAMRRDNVQQAQAILEKRIEDPEDYLSRLQLADLLRSHGNKRRADELLAEASRIAPDAPEVLQAQVRHQIAVLKDMNAALRRCNEAIAKKPTPEGYRLRAGVHEEMGSIEKAAADLRKLASLEGQAEKGYLALGRLHYKSGDLEKALQGWREGLSACPESVLLRGALAEAMIGSGDAKRREQARQIIEARLAEDPDDPEFLVMRADCLFDTDPKEAERIWQRVAEKHPESAKAFARLVSLAMNNHRTDQALRLIEQGLSANPGHSGLLLLQSRLLLNDSPSRAAIVARKALQADPDNESAAIAYANALHASGALEEALDVLSRFLAARKGAEALNARLRLSGLLLAAAEKCRKNRDTQGMKTALTQTDRHLRQADALTTDRSRIVQIRFLWHRLRDEWDTGLSLVREHLKARPDDLAVADLAGSTLLTDKQAPRRELAIAFFQHIVQQRPEVPQSYSALCMAYYELGRIAEARRTLERGLKVAPDHADLVNDLAWIICEEQGDPKSAEKLARKRVQAGKDVPPTLWDTWGVVQYRLGRTEESAGALREALAHPRANETTRQAAMFHLARTLAAEDPDESKRLLDELLRTPAEQIRLSASELEEARTLHKQLVGDAPAEGTSKRPAESTRIGSVHGSTARR